MATAIRSATAEELPMLCDSIASLELWKNLRISGEELKAACSRDPDRLIYVADEAGSAVGCIMFRPERALEFLCERVFRSGIIYPAGTDEGMNPGDLPEGAYVNMLAVFEGFQGAGAGAALLDAAEIRSRENSDRIYLCVSLINARGRAFYERQGYTFVAEARDCVKPGNTEHLMQKMLR